MSELRSIRRWGVAVIVVLSILASCGGDDETAPTSDPGSTTTSAPTTSGSGTGPDSSEGTDGSQPSSSLESVRIRAREVARLEEPTAMEQRPDDDRLYVAERAGRIRMLTPDGEDLQVSGPVVLDISDDVTTEAERGLLGLAFSADGSVIYVSHTNADGDSRLLSYELQSDGTADTSSKKVLLAVEQPFPNHNGGHVTLGPDGYLYFGFGDGGAADDPDNRAQDPDELLGKILRIDPTRTTGDQPYAIPAGNPYRSGGGRPEIYLSGARNPWRFSFDRSNGDLWIGDVGQNAVEEVDWFRKGTGAGRNLGWSGYEGSTPYLDGEGRRPSRSVFPVFEYQHDDGACSITGGYVYRGARVPALQGAYLFADYCVGELRALRLGSDGKVSDERQLGVEVDQPISFTQDSAGELYVLSQAGAVSRLEPG